MKQISKYQKESFHRKLTSILVIIVLVTDNLNPNKCKVGVVDSKGQKYAVSGGSNLNLYGEANSNGVEVYGEFIPASEDETYDIVGTIKRL